ncbi:DUF3618 domain-containing protein [Rhodococcus sp. T9N]|jgi:hypothetical protein|uniref:DUF3618 domain-containing protein n=1 Tax=Rhodococcus sp. T9N TaxID=627445 RepID=UPI0021C3E096|nr:DUF3618 domain-containing protein [Rhodococcus sp. T9N]
MSTASERSADNGEQDIQAQRESLAVTINALAEKADVPTRLKSQFAATAERLRERPAMVAVVLGSALILGVVVARRKLRARSSSGA